MTDATQKITFHVGKDKPQTDEKVDEDVLKKTVARMFPESGANIQEQTGTWKGEVESGSWRIEHIDIAQKFDSEKIESMRETLERKFEQDMVLATVEEVEVA